MAGDDHPDKKVFAAGESSKEKAALEEGEIVEKEDEEEEDDGSVTPPPSPPSLPDVPSTTAMITIDVPPVKKKFKSINEASSVTAAAPAGGSGSDDGRARGVLALPSQPSAPAQVAAQRLPPRQVPCPLCNRMFDSYPAMFGHQRVHKERTYRGAYPPPTFNTEGSLKPGAEDTEAVARQAAELLVEMSKAYWEEQASLSLMELGKASSSLRAVALDLNIPLQQEKEDDKEKELKFDLNRSPPTSEE
ncbi:hypothetical protein QQ045_009939 [Rhodiola kirilowii]